MNIDLKNVKPYGDTMNDGAVQLSFSLPIPNDEKAEEAARQLALKMGFEEPRVAHRSDLGGGYSFFIVYGRSTHGIDLSAISVPKVESETYDFYEINRIIEEEFGRKLVIVGACTGADAHTVGIDAIMNMKGFNQHYGLERYSQIEAINLGSQVPNEDLIRFAMSKNADAILVSQIVTAKDSHLETLTEFIELCEGFSIRGGTLLIAGGPRIGHKLALELGFDAGFGSGTYAEDVASFVIHELRKRK